MKESNKSKKYTCIHCKGESEIVGVVQTERHHYSVDLSTSQWSDFHGDEDVESQEFFCIRCNKKIDTEVSI